MLTMILDREFNRLTSFDLGEYNPKNFTVINDKQEYTIVDNVLLSTFSCTVNKNWKESIYFSIGNYITFKDEKDKIWCFVINDIKKEDNKTIEVYAEDLGLDLLNSASLTFKNVKPQPIEYYINREIYDTGWKININESKLKKSIDFDTSSTTLKRLQDIAKAFDCEIDFSIDLQGKGFTKKDINIRKKIGSDEPVCRLTEGQEIQSLQKSTNIKELRTACYAFGSEGVDISGISYNDGVYRTDKGSNLVYNINSNIEWNRYTIKGANDFGFYEMVYESQSKDPYVVLMEAIKELGKKDKVLVEYECSVNYNLVKNQLNIGDTIQLVDPQFNLFKFEPLCLEARVTGISISRMNPSSNTLTISNFKEVDSGISERIKSLANKVNENQINNVTIQIDQTTQGTKTILNAKVMRGNEDITDNFDDKSFRWAKYYIDGSPDVDFNNKYTNSPSKIVIDTNTVDRTNYFTCTILTHDFILVSAKYFQNGLISLAQKIKKNSTKDSTIVIFGTDLHYATSSWLRASDKASPEASNINIFPKSNRHIENMVELTTMVDVDLVVLGGDLADGSTSKEEQTKALKKIMSTLGQVNSTYLVCEGNHDSNTWYARKLCGVNYDLRNVIVPNEMKTIISDPLYHQDNVEINSDLRTAYFDNKNIRHIILNSSDVPYKLNPEGNPETFVLEAVGYSEAQLKWLIEILDSTPDNYKVCVYQHMGYGNTYSKNTYTEYNSDGIMQILEAFHNHKQVHFVNNTPNFEADVSADFTNNKATILYGIHGHYHNDAINKRNGINYISTGCSCPIPRHLNGQGLLDNRDLDTLNEDLFDVLILTPNTNKIKIFRYGAGKDREITLDFKI